MLTGTVLFGDEDVRLTFNDRVRGDTLVNTRLAQLGFAGDVAHVLARAMIARPDDRIAGGAGVLPALARSAQGARRRTASRRSLPSAAHPPDARMRPPTQARPLALEVEGSGGIEGKPVSTAPASERVVTQGERRIRYVQVHEKLDLSFLDPERRPGPAARHDAARAARPR